MKKRPDPKSLPKSPGRRPRQKPARTAKGVNRDTRGRWLPGTCPGPGNPYIKQLAAWRAAWMKAITTKDITAVCRVLVDAAKAGEGWAVVEMLRRCLGKCPDYESELEGRLDELSIRVVRTPLPGPGSVP